MTEAETNIPRPQQEQDAPGPASNVPDGETDGTGAAIIDPEIRQEAESGAQEGTGVVEPTSEEEPPRMDAQEDAPQEQETPDPLRSVTTRELVDELRNRLSGGSRVRTLRHELKIYRKRL